MLSLFVMTNRWTKWKEEEKKITDHLKHWRKCNFSLLLWNVIKCVYSVSFLSRHLYFFFFFFSKNDYNLFKKKIILWFIFLSKNKRLTFFFIHLNCFHFRFYDIYIRLQHDDDSSSSMRQCSFCLRKDKEKSIAPTNNRFIITVCVSYQMLYNILLKSRYSWKIKREEDTFQLNENERNMTTKATKWMSIILCEYERREAIHNRINKTHTKIIYKMCIVSA